MTRRHRPDQHRHVDCNVRGIATYGFRQLKAFAMVNGPWMEPAVGVWLIRHRYLTASIGFL